MPPNPVPSLNGPLLALARRDAPSLAPGDTLFDAARRMAAQRLAFMPVLDAQGRALGVVTELRLLGAAYGPNGPAQAITDVMEPAVCVPAHIDAAAGFQRCLAEGGAPLLLLDTAQRVVAVVGEGEFRARLQLPLADGRNRVSALMARVQRPLAPGHTLAQAIEQMRHSGSTAVVVAEDDRVHGVLTARDVARLLAAGADTAALRLDAVMSQPVLALSMDATIHEAAELMLAHRVRHLVVQDEQGRLVGVLDEHELIRAMAVQVMDKGIERDLPAMAPGRRGVTEEERAQADDGHRDPGQAIQSPVFDAEEEYRWLFNGNPAPMYVFERESLALLRVNQAFCSLYGHTEAQALAMKLTDLYLPEDHATVRAMVGGSQGLLDVGERRHLRVDGRVVHVVVRSHDIRLQGRACRVAVVTDVSLQHRSRQRDRQRLALMERLAQGEPLASLLDQLARDHEALFPGSLCSVLLLTPDGLRLQHAASPSLPAAYVQAIDGIVIGPDVGSCGASAHCGQRVVVADIDTHPNWQPFLPLTRAAGLRACWSEPVRGSAGAVLGTFAVYRHEPGLPDPEELDHMQFAVQLAATAITQGGTTRALRDSERRLEQVLQAIPDMVWQKDADGVYRTCNAAFARMISLPVERIIGSRDEDLAEAARAAEFRRQDQQVLSSRQPLSLERWMTVRSTGQHVLTELIKTPLFDDDGRPAGVLGVARDITLIKQGARAVAEQQRLIDTMLAQTTDAIVLVDPATLRFVTFNDAACQGLGYSREDFAELTPGDLQAEQGLAEIRENVQRAMAGEQVRFDTRHRRADGSIQHAALTLRRVTYGGRSLLSSVWRDVTEDRRHQARIERLNRSYEVLSAVNEAVVRLREREALFAEVCRITTQVGGFNLAWIGQVDEADGHIVALGESGTPADYVRSLRLSVWDGPDKPGAKGLIAQALNAGTVKAVQDIATSPEVPIRRQQLLSHGHRSLAVFPILPAGGQRLALVVYSGTPDHFDGEQIGLFGRLAKDVGFALEFIAAQQASDEAQRFREQLIESVAGLFFALDPSGRLVLWNRRVQEVTGYTPQELTAKDAADFFPQRERALVMQRLREGLERGEAQVEARLVSRNGRRTPHLFVARRLDMARGPLLVGTGIDISARVRSERRLARYGNQLGFLVQRRTAELEAVNVRLHREDRRLRAMLALSQRASILSEDEIFRLGLGEILAQTGSTIGCLRCVDEGASPDGAETGTRLQLRAWAGMDSPPPDALARQVLERAEACTVEGGEVQCLADGLDGIQRLVGAPVLVDGRVVLVVCAANRPEPYAEADVRELQLLASDLWGIVQRRRTEIALGEAKVAADAANQAKSAFLANMSHEIRTPMNAVIGFAHLLRRDPLTPRQQDHLAKITDAGQHLMQVINDILDFSKIEAQKVTLENADFSLRDSLDRVRAMQLDAARGKQLPLELQVDPGCPALLSGDRLRLEQVLLNLLSNAVKFTSAGSVSLRVRPLAAPPAGGPVWLRFEVVDTGIGMTADQVAHVFEAFAQADVSTTRRFGGTGLGLAISKRLVQLMSGRIGALSQPGQGSTFWVELPLQPAQGVRARPAAPAGADAGPARGPNAGLRGLHVLVAEDNPINQEVTATLLASLGVGVDLVASGEEALRTFDVQRHDLVLMDVQMPGMDGLRATAALRQRADGRSVPIIAMTANAFAEDRQQCLAAGMNDHLGKPVEPQALEACLRRWRRAPTPQAAAEAMAAGEGEQAVRQRLQAMPGLDTRSPLARMRGAWPLYLRTLRMFADHHAGDAQRLAQLGAAGDVQALRGLAHSLAGAAATVGAVSVQRQAQALQQQLDGDPGPPGDAWRPLAEALHDLLQQVRAALQPGEAEAPPTPRPSARVLASAHTVLLQLQPLVAAHDTAALALYERHRADLEAALGARAQALSRQLGNFSFDEAEAALAQALAQLAAPAG